VLKEQGMNTTTDNTTEPADLREAAVELLHVLGARQGADLDAAPDRLGFFAAVAASLAKADELSAADRKLHASALFDLIVKLADPDDPGFAAGWNTALNAQMVMMKASSRTDDGLSEAGYETLKNNAAELWRTAPEAEAG
jgi:hypothetical protein